MAWTIEFTQLARDDLKSISAWIAHDDERAAERTIDRILGATTMLCVFPKLGYRGRESGTRELKVPRLPYVAIYQLIEEDERIEVVRVLHTARGYFNS